MNATAKMGIRRRYLDLGNLTLNGQTLPVVYVNSKIIWTNKDPAFSEIIKTLQNSPKPGFYLTPLGHGDKTVRVRFGLNRHCILQSELFRDSKGNLYRDIDAKGVGYTRSFPIRVLPTCPPELSGDMESRGILHNEVAKLDCMHSEALYRAGIRMARHIAHIELFELVNEKGDIVPREMMEDKIGRSDRVRPTIAIRAQGTTARIWDLYSAVISELNNLNYMKEIIEDAKNLISTEYSHKFTTEEYLVWFCETLAKQLAAMHKKGVRPDFTMQIHGGQHNVTLDCKLTDTAHYVKLKKEISMFSEAEKKEIEGGEKEDIVHSKSILKTLSRALNMVFSIDEPESKINSHFDKVYYNSR